MKPDRFWKILTLALGFVPAVCFGLVGGWFIYKLVDLGKLPWQDLLKALVAWVAALVITLIILRWAYKATARRLAKDVGDGFTRLAEIVRDTPGVLTTPAFWLDKVWPALLNGREVVMAWVGFYGTMVAVFALATLLCQTGSLAVSYLQVDRLDKQNEKLDTQNKLLEEQNRLLTDQNLLSESARRAALLQIVGDVLSSIDAEEEPPGGGAKIVAWHPGKTERADKRSYRSVRESLLGRLAAACSSLRGYRYLGDDGKPVAEPRSPERGFVLRSLIAASIDITSLIDQRADFSYAEAENAVLDYFRLEPSPLEVSSVPGSRGLILKNAWLDGTTFRGSRLGDANFYRASLINANFSGARLRYASFDIANVSGAQFSDADLRWANFNRSDLTAADFANADTLGATVMPPATAFLDADLTDIELAGAYVDDTNWLQTVKQDAKKFEVEAWKLIPATNPPRSYHQQSEIETDELKRFQWRIANPDGAITRSGRFGGSVIVPRRDQFNPEPTPPKSKGPSPPGRGGSLR